MGKFTFEMHNLYRN